MPTDRSLDQLRAEIDAIDDRIHDLLMGRTEVVDRIGRKKRNRIRAGSALRPGREAIIIRRLVKRHRGRFPKSVIVRLWRELLAAQVALQGPFSVAVFAPRGEDLYRDIARDQFSSLTPLSQHATVNQVIQSVSDGAASVGVLPMPFGEKPDSWWHGLIAEGAKVPRVIARLPFAQTESIAAERGEALAIACAELEPTGDDLSLVAVELATEMSRDRLRDTLEDCGFTVGWIGSAADETEPRPAPYLVSIEGFVTKDDPRLNSIQSRPGPEVGRVLSIGGYARPLTARDLAAES
ncbi:MAG: chorismate mutase [Alphaproteobacteria bacterium]|jgi:chorismate mutase-like protein|nr:chorismate mutase [Alphaproteobacteria bacterium]MDP6517350.1 chorismate mutase [Alphaproteobacteria bacterium]